MIISPSFRTKASPERQRNLTNVRHLFHRRTDERGQTFPFRLENDSQATTKFSCRVHDRIVREGFTDFRQRMIKREVTGNRGMRIWRISPWRSAGTRRHFCAQNLATLLDTNWQIADRSHKSLTDLFPMKDLARIECLF